jgi:hypothetical protein
MIGTLIAILIVYLIVRGPPLCFGRAGRADLRGDLRAG